MNTFLESILAIAIVYLTFGLCLIPAIKWIIKK